MNVRRTQAERTEATRGALMAAARELFADRGYTAVSTEQIVQRADVTRGALYHHFRGKDDLFRAVFEQIEGEVAEKIAAVALEAGGDAYEALRAGGQLFLDLCGERDIQRIALLDAPAVLGWEQWRAIEARYGLGMVEAALAQAMESGALPRQPVKPLAHMLLGALTEAGMLIATADEPTVVRAEVGQAVDRLLEGLRK